MTDGNKCGMSLSSTRVSGTKVAGQMAQKMVSCHENDHRQRRLVIPKDIRRESGIKPGMPLEVRWEKGAIAITPAPLTVKLERKGRLIVAVPPKNAAPLSTDTVEQTRKVLRKERSVAST